MRHQGHAQSRRDGQAAEDRPLTRPAPGKPTASLAIVGSGIAGLAAAVFLRRAGWDVTILERAPEPVPLGSGLLLQLPALDVLGQLGLRDAALEYGARVFRLEGCTRTGRRVMALDYGEWQAGCFGLGIDRGALWKLLRDAAVAERVKIEAGREVTAIAPQGERVCITHAGTALSRDFEAVLVASGARTALRACLPASDATRPYAWGAMWTNVMLPPGWPGDVLLQRYDGTRRMMGVLPTGRDVLGSGPGATVFWSERLDRIESVRAKGWAAWREAALHLWPQAEPVIEAIGGLEAFSVGAYADVRVAPWACGRVALVGDAAHGTSPQLGQGATLALLDARALSRVLVPGQSVEAGLARYEASRRAHARYYQFASRWLTPFFQSDGSFVGWCRDLAMLQAGRLPIVRREFLATLVGRKAGLLFSRLEP